jgi:hypothetical protein
MNETTKENMNTPASQAEATTLRKILARRFDAEEGPKKRYIYELIPDGREWNNDSARLFVERDRVEVVWFITGWGSEEDWLGNPHPV